MKNKKAYKKVVIDTMTFVEAVQKGLIDYENIEDYVDKWHEGKSNKNIAEFLGMTKEQYFRFLEGNENTLRQMFPRKRK